MDEEGAKGRRNEAFTEEDENVSGCSVTVVNELVEFIVGEGVVWSESFPVVSFSPETAESPFSIV